VACPDKTQRTTQCRLQERHGNSPPQEAVDLGTPCRWNRASPLQRTNRLGTPRWGRCRTRISNASNPLSSMSFPLSTTGLLHLRKSNPVFYITPSWRHVSLVPSQMLSFRTREDIGEIEGTVAWKAEVNEARGAAELSVQPQRRPTGQARAWFRRYRE
jgi:hypothetical protein